MEKIVEEAYDIIRRKVAVLLCGRSTDDSMLRCVDGWMAVNDMHVILQRLYRAGQTPINEAEANKI